MHGTIDAINLILVTGSGLVLVGIMTSLIAMRFGAPLLLIFLGVGMLAGEDGPGGILFSDFSTTYLVGGLALAVVLFDGGLRTRLVSLKDVWAPSLLLATLGVLVSASLVALAAVVFFDLEPLEGLLIGSVISSTDAAAVFFLLRQGGIRLRRRLSRTLEIESGTNDPFALFMTIAVTEALVSRQGHAGWGIAGTLAQQMSIGALIGLGGGFSISLVLSRLELPSGLHPVFAATGAVLIYAVANIAGGSGFLAVYLAGLVVGNRPLRAHASILGFHDAATWLCQIIMFVVLGLLATPHRLIEYAVLGTVIAGVLILIARPAGVLLCLWPFKFSVREMAFVSWVGLRGAVSIFLASIPILSQVPHADLVFHVAFFVVISSLIIQGWTIAPLAQRLRVAIARSIQPTRRVELDLPGQLDYEMVGYPVTGDMPILIQKRLPDWARLALVIRKDKIVTPSEAGEVAVDDYIYFFAPPQHVEALDRLFARDTEFVISERAAVPELIFDAAMTLGQLAKLYGLLVPTDLYDRTIADHFAEGFDGPPLVGDHLDIGGLQLTIRAVAEDKVKQVGLRLEEPDKVGAWHARLKWLKNLRRHYKKSTARR
ncbi:MAG: potassium/proton antiporter [Alphaproteobacteria bacterium]